MKTHGRSRSALAVLAFLGLVSAFSPGDRLSAEETPPSSTECIKCHTDLEKMDAFGAASTSGAAAIAG